MSADMNVWLQDDGRRPTIREHLMPVKDRMGFSSRRRSRLVRTRRSKVGITSTCSRTERISARGG